MGKHVEVDTEEMSDFFFTELVKRGFNVTDQEADHIADIAFDYLIKKQIIDEHDVEDHNG